MLAVVPVVPAAGAPAAALVGKRRFGRRVGLTDRRKLLSPADRSRSEIATGAERVMRGASFSAGESTAQTPGTSGVTDSKQEEVIPLAEEELQVGKRTVDRGTTKIRRYVVRKPVEESVTLRDETVSVERRRPVTQGEAGVPAGAFEERTVEVHQTAEEPVVNKTARVAEEVVVHKDVTERTETVRDDVRREEVEVQKDADRRPG